jgi:2-C-methyl-D-erythritol 4-phosphate cytidylyltransferase
VSVAGLIPAAGSGLRLGRGPKAFVRIDGRTLIERAARLLAPFVDALVVAVPPGREAEARQALEASLASGGRTIEVTVVAGGATRQATVERLILACEADWLIVHDAARPFTPADVVERVLSAARASGAATAGLAVADTLHDLERDVPVPREALRAVQTPQAFARSLLLEAHRHGREAALLATDDAGLVRALGRPVAWVEGSPWSHKLTGPGDLPWLEALARARADGATRSPA